MISETLCDSVGGGSSRNFPLSRKAYATQWGGEGRNFSLAQKTIRWGGG